MTAPRYWATADRTKSASGWAVFSQRVSGPVERSLASGAGASDRAYSNSSGSVWAISSHSGWKLNQPAAWNPVFCWV